VSAALPLDIDDQTWSWALPFAPASAGSARTHLTVALRSLSVSQAIVDDARMVVSELVGNALRHARPLPHGMLRVELVAGHDFVRVCVVDGGSVTLPALLHTPVLSLGGRGLAIVRSLTRDWGVRETRTGNIVFGVLDRA